jgi:hypothetical protein
MERMERMANWKLKFILPGIMVVGTIVVWAYIMIVGRTLASLSTMITAAIAGAIPFFFIGWGLDYLIERLRNRAKP